MTATHESVRFQPGRWLNRLKRLRLVLAAAAIVFAGLWGMGALEGTLALIGFALIALAAVIAIEGPEIVQTSAGKDQPPALPLGDPLIEAVLAALPDPVVALDRQGDVVALNAKASEGAPGVPRGEPVAGGFRVPEIGRAHV